MEVEVNGVSVAYGGTMSATGEMSVKSTQPYVLEVDDVVWSPISSSNGVDVYLLSTSGTVKIFVDNTLVFYFLNTINTDFDILSTGSRQYNGGTLLKTNYNVPSYNQDVLLSDTNNIYLVVNAINITKEELQLLPLTCNNGTIQNATYSEGTTPSGTDYVSLIMTVDNVVSDTYCAVFCGNVLSAFFTPVS